MRRKKSALPTIIFYVVFFCLLFSLLYTARQLFFAPFSSPEWSERNKSDYILSLLQCVLGLLVLFLPSALEKRLSIALPDLIATLYFIFLFGAVFLGEIRSFYYRVPHFDVVLHALSGLMAGALGLSLASLLNRGKRVVFQLSPGFIALVAFLFGCTVGLIWEIYEFAMDGIFGVNMQKTALESGEMLLGRAALQDTMKDLIVDALASLAMSLVGYFSLRGSSHLFKKLSVRFLPRAK
ncbi:MAG: hypothetical protein LBU47_06815 [Christensenellaceae bacterium]|jgi:hypothetical protein|nr:hypothetical protein [Christensenellaceae bacterium]